MLRILASAPTWGILKKKKKNNAQQPRSWSTKEDAETYSMTELFNIQNRVLCDPKNKEIF
jgi:hypothetical protein